MARRGSSHRSRRIKSKVRSFDSGLKTSKPANYLTTIKRSKNANVASVGTSTAAPTVLATQKEQNYQIPSTNHHSYLGLFFALLFLFLAIFLGRKVFQATR